jgi:hypothetical protein
MFKPGDLVKYGFSLGILLRKLQWDEFEQEDYLNWDGEPAWWIQWAEENTRRWNYEEELTLISKVN